MTTPTRIATAAEATEFALAGNATLTLVSKRTQQRFTFRVRKPQDDERDERKLRFVSLMNGPDNESSFAYLGFFRNGSYEHGRKSKIGSDSPAALAFGFFASTVVARGVLPEQLEVWHEGRCGRCGRKLTVPSSIASGIGPECAKHVGGRLLAEAA
jgi:hypothetical protein